MFQITNALIKKMDFALSGINNNNPDLSQSTTFAGKCWGCDNSCSGDCWSSCYLGCTSENRL